MLARVLRHFRLLVAAVLRAIFVCAHAGDLVVGSLRRGFARSCVASRLDEKYAYKPNGLPGTSTHNSSVHAKIAAWIVLMVN